MRSPVVRPPLRFASFTYRSRSAYTPTAVEPAAHAVSGADPRRALLTLTAAGTRLVLASREHRASRLRDLLAGCSGGDVIALADLLTRFAETAGRPRMPRHRPGPAETIAAVPIAAHRQALGGDVDTGDQ